jgi:glycerol uptake operon antiterminator
MIVQSNRFLLDSLTQCRHKTIPAIENRVQFAHVFDMPQIGAVALRHCNLFEFAPLLERAHRQQRAVYVNIDHIEGIHADAAGFSYLAHQLYCAGIISSNPRTLLLAKQAGMETIQRIFAADSTGLHTALESVDTASVDVLDISPALVIPHLLPYLDEPLPLPVIGSGLIHTRQQVQEALRAGAVGVIVTRSDLWP